MIETISATENELALIQQLAHQIWPSTFKDILSKDQMTYMLHQMYSLEALKEQIQSKGHVFLLAKEKGEYLGYTSYELNYKGLSQTKIHKLYLLPAAQGKGVGRHLIQYIRHIAETNGNKVVSLNVNKYNSAIQFYYKVGFVKTAEENIPIGNNYWMEDFVMEMHSALP